MTFRAGNSAAKSGPRLGALPAVFDAKWAPDSQAGYRNRRCHSICQYYVGGLHVVVNFDRSGHADDVLLVPFLLASGRLDTRWQQVNRWRFLQSVVPSNARRLKCAHLQHSWFGGSVDACSYRWGRKYVVVGTYDHPNPRRYEYLGEARVTLNPSLVAAFG
jgi:hypothetical protein